MSGPIPAGYETDEDDLEDGMYGDGSKQQASSSFYTNVANTSNGTIGKDVTIEEPIDWQSAIQSSMDDSRFNDHNETTLHSANSKLGDTTLSGDATLNNDVNGSNREGTKTYNPFDEYKTSDGCLDLDTLNDRNLPDEDVDDNQSLPPHGQAQNLKIYGDLELFLCYIKEDDLIELFDKHEVTFRQLLTCDEQDLINIGIDKVGIRKKILESVSMVHARKWEPTSLTDLTAQDLYTSPGIFLVLSDIKKHQEYIKDTIDHLKTKIQSDAEIFELGKDFVGINKIMEESMEVVEASENLYKAAANFANYIRTKKLDLPQLQPANHINQEYIKTTFKKQRAVTGYTLAAILLLSLVAFKVTKW